MHKDGIPIFSQLTESNEDAINKRLTLSEVDPEDKENLLGTVKHILSSIKSPEDQPLTQLASKKDPSLDIALRPTPLKESNSPPSSITTTVKDIVEVMDLEAPKEGQVSTHRTAAEEDDEVLYDSDDNEDNTENVTESDTLYYTADTTSPTFEANVQSTEPAAKTEPTETEEKKSVEDAPSTEEETFDAVEKADFLKSNFDNLSIAQSLAKQNPMRLSVSANTHTVHILRYLLNF